jgi:hypothetical protein
LLKPTFVLAMPAIPPVRWMDNDRKFLKLTVFGQVYLLPFAKTHTLKPGLVPGFSFSAASPFSSPDCRFASGLLQGCGA